MNKLATHSETEDLGGKFRTTFHLKPIAYVRDGIPPRRITNQMQTNLGGNLPIGVNELIDLRIRDRLAGNSPVIYFGKGQSSVRFTPLGANNVSGLLVSDNVWEYPGAWNGTQYLKLSCGGHIIRMEVLLLAGHPNRFQWRMDEHTGFDPVAMTVGEIRLGNPVLEKNNETIGLEWVVTIQGGKYILTVTLPIGDYSGWTLVL